MAQDWQIPGDAVCPDEPTCMYCGKICETTEAIYTGEDEGVFEGIGVLNDHFEDVLEMINVNKFIT